MTRRPSRAAVTDDGLRYTARPAGTPFTSSPNSPAIRSCFMCGRHKNQSEGRVRKLALGNHFVCFGCKPDKAEAPAPTVQLAESPSKES